MKGCLNAAVWKTGMKEDVCLEGIRFADPNAVISKRKIFLPFRPDMSSEIESKFLGDSVPPMSEEQKETIEKAKDLCDPSKTEKFREQRAKTETAKTLGRGKVAIGKMIRLRHKETKHNLHSHPQKYVGGSKEQQITCYESPDVNDFFTVVAPYGSEIDFGVINNGGNFRLFHKMTGKFIHSAKGFESPASKQQEVSAVTDGKENDNWQMFNVDGSEIFRASFEVRLKHVTSGCYLHSHKQKFQIDPKAPHYGEHQEVTCFEKEDDPNNVWIIEKIQPL